MKIAVFDSGVGGLASLARLARLGVARELFYYADLANLPFGSKSKIELERIIFNDINAIFAAGADLIVVACNTACTVLPNSPQLCKISDFTARVVQSNPQALLLCTQATLASGIYPARYAAAAPELVLCAQNGEFKRAKEEIKKVIDAAKCSTWNKNKKSSEKFTSGQDPAPSENLFSPSIPAPSENLFSQVIAGCTHFGLLRLEFAALGLELLDPVDLFAREIAGKFKPICPPEEVILHFNEASMQNFYKEYQCRF